jgi:hypothetical protein
MSFEKNFRRLPFSSNVIKIPESSKRRSIEKKEEKILEKRERERERKRKALRVSSNKNGKSIF